MNAPLAFTVTSDCLLNPTSMLIVVTGHTLISVSSRNKSYQKIMTSLYLEDYVA